MTMFPPPAKSLLSSGSGASFKVVTLTAAQAVGLIDLGKAFNVLRIQTQSQGRFRLYRDAATRDADLSRPATTKARAGLGLILEEVTTPERLAIDCSPIPSGAPIVRGQSCAWSWDGTTGATITLDITQLEA